MTDTMNPKTIDVVVNGSPMTTDAQTVADLVAALGHDASSVATARNGDFVPRTSRSTARLTAGDRVEVVSPRQGG